MNSEPPLEPPRLLPLLMLPTEDGPLGPPGRLSAEEPNPPPIELLEPPPRLEREPLEERAASVRDEDDRIALALRPDCAELDPAAPAMVAPSAPPPPDPVAAPPTAETELAPPEEDPPELLPPPPDPRLDEPDEPRPPNDDPGPLRPYPDRLPRS